jgi:formylglycine-generating enzyme required for sulfatase activity
VPADFGVQFSWEQAPTSQHAPYTVWPAPLFADIIPATNGQWRRFLLETGWAPQDTRSFLAHWRWGGCSDANVSACMPTRMKRQPVVYVSPSDASAYCAWRGGRLPTDWEWAFLASASPAGRLGAVGGGWDVLQWPWGNHPCNSTTCPPPITTARGLPQGVHAYDKLPEVGSFPQGASPWGMLDMAGVVRQWVGGTYCDVGGNGASGGAVGSTCRALSRGGTAWQPSCLQSKCYYPLPHSSNAVHFVHAYASEAQLRNGFTGLRCVAGTPGGRRRHGR